MIHFLFSQAPTSRESAGTLGAGTSHEEEETLAAATSREEEGTHAASTPSEEEGTQAATAVTSSTESEDEMPSKVPKVRQQLPVPFCPLFQSVILLNCKFF